MPHLAPMPWLMYMTTIWVIMGIMTTNMWWFMNKSTKSINNPSAMNIMLKWKW